MDFLSFLNLTSQREEGATTDCADQTLLKLEWHNELISLIMVTLEESTSRRLRNDHNRESMLWYLFLLKAYTKKNKEV